MIKVTYDDLKIFEDMDESTLNILQQKCFKRKLKKGDALFYEKDRIDEIYIVIYGKVTVYRISENGQKRIIYILDNGNLINEDIFGNASVSVSCEAFEDSWVLCISKQDIVEIMAKDCRFSSLVLTSMSKKIRRLYRQLKNAVPIRMDKKLAAKLWKLSRDYGVEVEGGVLIDLDISITYLADMLGSTRETISRCISDFKKKSMVEFHDKKIIIPDVHMLSSYFRGI